MSNPTELQYLDKLEALARAATPGPWVLCKYGSVMDDAKNGEIVPAEANCEDREFIAGANPAAVLALIALARRAQPEGEAPQADITKETIQRLADLHFYEGAAASMDIRLYRFAAALLARTRHAATLSPLCGAKHAESGKDGAAIAAFKTWHEEVGDQDCEYTWLQAWTAAQCANLSSAPGTPEAPQPPFPVSDEEMAALRRFWECASDGEGYDVEKTMMQRLAEMGLVQRKSGAYYMATDFGLYVLGEYTIQRAAQLDGGQERDSPSA